MIELLVVIAILSLLVAMLMPFLGRAREIARRAICLSNSRNLATAALGFAVSHAGRGPGGGLITIGNYSSIDWTDVLNAEFYRAPAVCRGLWWWPLPKNQIVCPNARLYGGRWYTCTYQWNLDAAGGPATTGEPPEGPYGLAVDPARVQYMYNALWRTTAYGLTQYHLGAVLERFPRPTYTFLQIESEHANSTIGWMSAADQANPCPVVNGNANGSLPPWAAGTTGPGDFYGFRHVLPREVSLYQKQATACFSYVDGHVSIVNPGMDLNMLEHYQLRPPTP